MTTVSTEYRTLLARFADRELSPEEFGKSFLEKFKSESRNLDVELFDVLDVLFGEVDSFTRDEVLLQKDPGFYLDETALRLRVTKAIEKLDGLIYMAGMVGSAWRTPAPLSNTHCGGNILRGSRCLPCAEDWWVFLWD